MTDSPELNLPTVHRRSSLTGCLQAAERASSKSTERGVYIKYIIYIYIYMFFYIFIVIYIFQYVVCMPCTSRCVHTNTPSKPSPPSGASTCEAALEQSMACLRFFMMLLLGAAAEHSMAAWQPRKGQSLSREAPSGLKWVSQCHGRWPWARGDA